MEKGFDVGLVGQTFFARLFAGQSKAGLGDAESDDGCSLRCCFFGSGETLENFLLCQYFGFTGTDRYRVVTKIQRCIIEDLFEFRRRNLAAMWRRLSSSPSNSMPKTVATGSHRIYAEESVYIQKFITRQKHLTQARHGGLRGLCGWGIGVGVGLFLGQ